jgi:tetratricopeptide (TPR) repeat protein
VPEFNYVNWDYLTWNLPAMLEEVKADFETSRGIGTGASSTQPLIAEIQARMHDPKAARITLMTTREDPHDPSINAMTHFVQGRLAAEAGEVTRAVTEMEAFGTAYASPSVATSYPGYECWIGPTEEAAGHHDRADVALQTGGTFVDCYRFRADILDARGDWSGAQVAYARAVGLAPDLPAAYFSWGLALARHGDLPGAVTKFHEANDRGPHWADPLKSWGDVLVTQGHVSEARAKYDEALTYAPNWTLLKDARDAAGKQKR